MRPKFNPSRGGHAPGHLRDELVEIIETGGRSPERMQRITGLLWNCTDCLPGDNCEELDIPRGSTYAAAARKIRMGME